MAPRANAGDIEAVGAEVRRWQVGNRVYLFNDNSGAPRTGTYGDHALCGPTQIATLPDAVTYQQGAAIGIPYATVFYGLFKRANGKPGETVFVHGASGGVGSVAVALLMVVGVLVNLPTP